jgi:hypothetical protein
VVFGLTKINLPDRHRLRSLAAMYALHGLNLALPLVTLPIITRALGPSEYGRYGVLINWAGIGVILIEFGMGIAATKQLTGTNDHQARVTQARVLLLCSPTRPSTRCACCPSWRPRRCSGCTRRPVSAPPA